MKLAALVSGGVDSAVALHRVVRKYPGQVHAYYLKIWLEDELSSLGECPWEEDLSYARAVCDQAGVELSVVPLQQEYYDRVVSYTLSELRAGRTPSPDIFCNQRVKFGAFLDVLADSVDAVVTGHYAQRELTDHGWVLKRAPDPVKDQTYFLSHLTQDQLKLARFPIGELRKNQVRQLARDLKLPNQNRPDSQGICFLGRIRYTDFVRHYLGEKQGAIVERETGTILGTHTGAWFYTIGQRQGLGLGNGPWYVVGKNLDSNTVWVSHRSSADSGARSSFRTGKPHWILRQPERRDLLIKLRHGPDLLPATVDRTPVGEGLIVQMSQSDRGVAPGQFSVFYEGERCLGGAMIREEEP